jgi:hypothetical protein
LVFGGTKKTPKIVCGRGKECGYSRGADETAPEPVAGTDKPAAERGESTRPASKKDTPVTAAT